MSIPGSYQPSEHTQSPAYRLPIDAPPSVADASSDAPRPVLSIREIDEIVFRQVQYTQAAGWKLERAWPGGADFVSREQSSISLGVHLLLCVLTVGLWIPVMIFMELNSSGMRRTRLAVSPTGEVTYTSSYDENAKLLSRDPK